MAERQRGISPVGHLLPLRPSGLCLVPRQVPTRPLGYVQGSHRLGTADGVGSGSGCEKINHLISPSLNAAMAWPRPEVDGERKTAVAIFLKLMEGKVRRGGVATKARAQEAVATKYRLSRLKFLGRREEQANPWT